MRIYPKHKDPLKKGGKFRFSEASEILSPRTPPAFDIPVKKLPVTSSRFGSIFDFHCSLTKPPGMLLFKDASPSPRTTAAVEGEKFPGELYRFGETFPSQVLISHSGRRQMPLTDRESARFSFLNSQARTYLFRDDCQDSFQESLMFIFSLTRSSSSPTRGTTRAPSGGAPANQQNTPLVVGGGGRLISVQFILKLDRIIMWCSHISNWKPESSSGFRVILPPVRKF